MPIEALYNDATKHNSAINNLYAQHVAAIDPSKVPQIAFGSSFQLPYQGAPHDGGVQDQANTKAITSQLEQYNNYQAALNDQPGWLDKLALGLNVGLATAGLGSVLGPAASGAVGGGTAGSIAGGAATGAAGGVIQGALTGSNIGKSALTGAVLGGVGGGLKPFVQGATGLTGATGNIVNSGITGAGTGAVRGALTGQGALGGALSGAQGGATNAVAGSIFNSGNTVSPQLTHANNPSTPNVSVDPSYFDTQGIQPIGMDTGYGSYNPAGDPNTSGFNNYGNNAGTNTDLASLMGGLNPNYQVSNQYLNQGSNSGGGGAALGGTANSLLSRLLGGNSGGNGSAGGGNSGLLGSLAGLFGGSNNSLLASLLGTGASALGGSLQSGAAKSAAGNFGNQTAFNPYSVNTNGGSTSFNGTQANSTLSPGQQQNSNALNGLTQSSAAGLQAGPQAASQGYFNNLQAQDRDANNHFYSSNLDNQMANGVLSSTAGQYQSQAALGAINNKTAQNQVMANNFGQNQQQQQLAQLTAGLNGSNQINQGQLAQTALGGNLGSAASGANSQAYSPSLAANSGSNIGNLLATMGNTQNSGSANQNSLLQYLLQGHG